MTIRIGLCGIGSVGAHVARLLLDHRQGAEIVAAVTKAEGDIGRRLHEVVGADAPGPVISDSIEALLAQRPEVVALCTGSFLPDVVADLEACAGAGADVVSPCEELAFPFLRDPASATRIDAAAKEGGVTVLGTGLNPGFIFDGLLAAASGACWDVNSIRGRRALNPIGFGQNIHLRLGIGYTREEFDDGHATGKIAGHVGFPESIELVCARMGLKLDEPVEQIFEPAIADADVPTSYGTIPPGYSEGFTQRAIGRVAGRDFITLELVIHLRAEEVGYSISDNFELEGKQPMRLRMDPGMDPLLATSAQLVNSIPAVRAATPGLKAVTDIPAPAAWLGDIGAIEIR